MWPFNQLKTVKKPTNSKYISENSHEFDDEDREISLETRRVKAELRNARLMLEQEKKKLEIEDLKEEIALKKLERQARIEDLTDGEEEEEDNSPDPMMALIAPLLQKFVGGSAAVGTPLSVAAPTQNIKVDLTEAEVHDVIAQYGDLALKYQKLPDSIIEKYIRANFPILSDQSVKLCIDCIKKYEVVK